MKIATIHRCHSIASIFVRDVRSTTAIESMKSRAQLGTGTHDALRPACPTSSGFSHMKTTLRRYPKYTEKYTELCTSDAIGMINEGLSRQFFKFCGYI